jgi:hypothetical protein
MHDARRLDPKATLADAKDAITHPAEGVAEARPLRAIAAIAEWKRRVRVERNGV